VRSSAQEAAGWAVVGAAFVALVLLVFNLGLDAPPLRILFGWGAFLIVPAIAAGGLALVLADRKGWRIRWIPVVCVEVFFLCLLGLSHISSTDGLADALLGLRGGLMGWGISGILLQFFPIALVWLVLIVVACAALAGLFIGLPKEWSAVLLPSDDLLHRLPGWPAVMLARLRRTRAELPGDAAVEDELGRMQPVPLGPAVVGAPKSKDLSRRRRAHTAQPVKRPEWLPPMDYLRPDPEAGGPAAAGAYSANARQKAQLIKQTLADFGVPVEVVSIKEGPTVTQFGIQPGEVVLEREGQLVRRKVSVQRILKLRDDLALELAAASLRIEAPVPGRPYVGIEVANTSKTLVNLRGVLESDGFSGAHSPLAVALGRDVSGDPVVVDLGRMPHLLIAGATGSGKSVCVNAIICSLLMSNGPETVRFVMVDPKMVELPGYNGAPHLLGPVITDPGHATAALSWLMLQMDDRYRLFSDAGVRNVDDYNRKARRSRDKRPLPYIILVIDELADLMMTAAVDVERQLCRLGQMARATGIHLVLATQRPSVDVITGLIKANFPARIAFAVTTQIDSRVILDTPGAEKLLGRGDMLFMAPDSAKLARIQGCYVSDREIERIVEFWTTRPEGEVAPMPETPPWSGMGGGDQDDKLLQQALKLLQAKTRVSTSLLQRQLRIGFPRAARLMDQLEEMGAVAPDEGGGRSREVLYRPESAEDAIL
jgi:DNA segregation ATPase FtsK/SpoIIIE, S-DNA-T family